MSLVLIAPNRDTLYWVRAIKAIDPEIDVMDYKEVKKPEEVEAVLLWQHPRGVLSEFPNLKYIASMGAGVDHIMSDTYVPDVTITRIVDPLLARSMTTYSLSAIMYYHRQLDRFAQEKSQKVWDQKSYPETPVKVGIYGLGFLGLDLAMKLKALEIPVFGFKNSPTSEAEIPCFFGDEQLDDFLQKINVLVCMLPLTPQTEGILNARLFARLPHPTFLINVARGKHLVEEDLIPAIENGKIAGAFLDVFHQEPLPKDHPFWSHPKIFITPHIASITNPDAAIPQIVENYHRMKKGLNLLNTVNKIKGY